MITGFFDLNNDFENTIEIAKNYNLNNICFKKINDQLILDVDTKTLNNVNNTLKKAKINVSLISGNIYLDFYNEKLKEKALNDFNKALKVANLFKTPLIIIEIGEIIAITEELENVLTILTPFGLLAKENNKEIVINYYENQKIAEIAYLFRNLNQEIFKVLFYPKMILRNKEAPATAYRLFRNYIGAFIAQDETIKQEPELLGYGDTDMINLFKRLKRDKYNYPILADHAFTENDLDVTKYKNNFIMRIVKKEKKRNLERIDLFKKRIFNNDLDKEVTLDNILDNQIKTLRLVFGQTK